MHIVKMLLEDGVINPGDHESEALDSACFEGHVEVVKLLLQDRRADPANGSCLDMACDRGHIETVRLLLKDGQADPSADNYEAVLSAYKKGHYEVMSLLIADPRVGHSGSAIAIGRYHYSSDESSDESSSFDEEDSE